MIHLLSIVVFSVGIYVALTQSQALFVLMGIELMIAASVLNFVSASRYDSDHAGLFVALFILALSVAEVALWLALLYGLQKEEQTTSLARWSF